jgi:predicted DNA-binding protein
MSDAQFIKTRVSSEMKERVHALAEQQLITESVWLKRLVAAAVRESAADESVLTRAVNSVGATRRDGVLGDDRDDQPSSRVYIRLRPDDRLLLRERARARGMPSATYVSVLVRAHLRNLPPLPKDELVALKRSVAELGAIGRNLNQLARAANSGDRVTGPGREDLRAMLKVCEALRDHVKGLIKANVNSWDLGHGESES